MEPAFEFPIVLPAQKSRRLLQSLHQQLRAAILDGRIKPGTRLPSTRALADAYGMSRNTALAAYDLLLGEGYLLTRPGAGVYVAQVFPPRSGQQPAAVDASHERRLNPYWRTPPAAIPVRRPAALRYDFQLGVPDQTHLPFPVWNRLHARALRALSKAPAAYAAPQGQLALCAAIAGHVSFARAVACRPEDIVVTAGAQQAFDLLARILVTPGRTVVAVEDPGYPPLRSALLAAGARLVPVPVDADGMLVERIPADARVICVTPSHQFPLGSVMSAQRRTELLAFAQARGAVIIEDDYDGEFRFGGRPLDALQTLDRSGAVFYVGTFSKSLFPALRLGFVVVPPWARPALIAAKQGADWHCAVAAQDTLAAFIAEGHLARHVRQMRPRYAARHQALLEGLQRDFGRWLRPVPCAAGLHLAALATPGLDADALLQRARRHGIGVRSLRDFHLGPPGAAGLVFGFGALDQPTLLAALTALRRLM